MSGEKNKILIIEDNQAVCEILREKLEEEGMKVDIAADGESGLRKLGESLPDVLLLDIIMPKLDGAKMLESIKQNRDISNLAVIVITNIPKEEAQKRCQGLPVKDIFVKAASPLDEIVSRVKEILKQQK